MLGGHPDQAARNERIMTSNYERHQQAIRNERSRLAKLAAEQESSDTAPASAKIVTKDLKVSTAKRK